jgi:hypothetical protein
MHVDEPVAISGALRAEFSADDVEIVEIRGT